LSDVKQLFWLIEILIVLKSYESFLVGSVVVLGGNLIEGD